MVISRAVWVLCVTVILAHLSVAQSQDQSQEVTLPARVTTFHPFFAPYLLGGRFPSILSHQAVLLSFREELQSDLADGSFEKRTAIGSQEDAYLLESWLFTDNMLSLQLRKFAVHPDDANRLGALSEPLWFLALPVNLDPEKLIPTILPQLEAASRKEILEVAKVCNLSGSPNRRIDTSTLPAAIEANLDQMDVVTQSLAVRHLHRIMREEGESPEVLGALVRAYAHLCVLTRHHWGYTSEVFSARSLLYAERLVARNRAATLGRWHRAYAAALSGLHAFALEDLEWIAQQSEGVNNDVPAPWCRLIAPVCKYEVDTIHSVAKEEPSIGQVAHILWFEAVSAQGDLHKSQAVGKESIEQVPGSLGIYYQLGNGYDLMMQRWAARTTPLAVANTILFICSKRAELPDAIREWAAEKLEVVWNDFKRLPNDRSSPSYPVRKVTDLLREFDSSSPVDGLPLRNIAFLIEEEVFLMAVGQLENASNATESDLRGLVEFLLPLVEGHRYAPYVESFAFNRFTERDSLRTALDRLEVGYTRWHMSSFWFSVYYFCSPEVSKEFRSLRTREYSAHDLETAFSNYSNSPQNQAKIAHELRSISPHSPHALEYMIVTGTDADEAQLRQWETEAANNYAATCALSKQYISRKMMPDAVRCLEHALSQRQTFAIAKELTDILWNQSEFERWQATWDHYLESPSLGLDHSEAQAELAYGHISLNRLDTALEYALKAAAPYSASGLHVAAICYEARKEYDDAQLWWQRLSEAYGGSSRLEWYYFCRRTGYGDLAAARDMARKYAEQLKKNDGSILGRDVAMLEIMDGSTSRAAELMRSEFEKRHDAWHLAQIGAMALRSDDTEFRQRTLDGLSELLLQVDDKEPDWEVFSRITRAIMDRLHGEMVDGAVVQAILDETKIRKASVYYFLGEILASLGDESRAAGMWEASVAEKQGGSQYGRTLAGFRRHQQQNVEPLPWLGILEEPKTESAKGD